MAEAALACAPAALLSRSRFLTFRVDERRYALPAEAVAEVIPVPPAARLPRSPKCLIGLANLRGTVIALIDSHSLLRTEAMTPRQGTRAIVLAGATPVALAVDAVDALVSVAAERVERRQVETVARPGEILRGAFHMDGAAGEAPDITRILDLPAMLAAAFGRRSEPTRSTGALALATQKAVETAAPAERQLLLSFEVAGQDFGLPIDVVREIIPLPRAIAVVPEADAVLLGVAARRDSLLPLLSLRALLGFPPTTGWSGREKVLVATVHGATVGLVADRARALVRAAASEIDPAPSLLAARSGGESKIAAIFRGNGGQSLISVLAPDRLFAEDVMRRLGDPSLHPGPQPALPAGGAEAHFVVFRLGDETFGLPISSVDEVTRVPKTITRVPKMPDFLEGVINLRGEVVPVVDQRRRFDLPKFAGDGGQRLLVVRAERHRAGLIVDHVSEVLRTYAEAIEPAPDLTGEGTRLVYGVINDAVAGRMILLLDPAELLTPVEQGALDAFESDKTDSL